MRLTSFWMTFYINSTYLQDGDKHQEDKVILAEIFQGIPKKIIESCEINLETKQKWLPEFD